MAVIDILKTATLLRDLNPYDTDPTLDKQFVEAVCTSQDVRTFTNYRGPLKPDEERYLMSAADLEQCVGHWPFLHTLTIYAFSSLGDEDQSEEEQSTENVKQSSTICDAQREITKTPPSPTCHIQSLRLENGHITDLQLYRLTVSSHSSLHIVFFQDLTGFTNAGLRTWLAAAGPAITDLTLKRTPVSGRTYDEEYAIDAMIPVMVNLRMLDVEGDVVSDLAVKRKEYNWAAAGMKGPDWKRFEAPSITIANAPGVNPHGLISALKCTDWSRVCVHRLFLDGDGELKTQADMVAREREIFFSSPQY